MVCGLAKDIFRQVISPGTFQWCRLSWVLAVWIQPVWELARLGAQMHHEYLSKQSLSVQG